MANSYSTTLKADISFAIQTGHIISYLHDYAQSLQEIFTLFGLRPARGHHAYGQAYWKSIDFMTACL